MLPFNSFYLRQRKSDISNSRNKDDLKSSFDSIEADLKSMLNPEELQLGIDSLVDVILVNNNPNNPEFFVIGKNCIGTVSKSRSDIREIESLLDFEVATSALINSEKLLVGDTKGKVHFINTTNQQIEYVEPVQRMKILNIKISNSQNFAYVLGKSKELHKIDLERTISVLVFTYEVSTLNMDLSPDNEHVATVCTGNIIYITKIKENPENVACLSTHSDPKRVKILNSMSIVACTTEEILIWTWGSWELVRSFHFPGADYIHLDVNSIEDTIAVGCKNGSIHIWDYSNSHKKPIILSNFNTKLLSGIKFIGTRQICYFVKGFNKIMWWKISDDFPKEFQYPKTSEIDKIIIPQTKQLIILKRHENGIEIRDLQSFKLKAIYYEGQDCQICLNADSDDLIVILKETNEKFGIGTIDLDTLPEEIPMANYSFSTGVLEITGCVSIPYLDTLVLSNTDGSIFLFSPQKNNRQIIQRDSITTIERSNAGTFIITGGSLGKLTMFNLINSNTTALPTCKSQISSISISVSDNLVVSGSVSGEIQLVDIHNNSRISYTSHAPVRSLHLNEEEKYLFVCTGKKHLSIWNLDSFSQIATEDNIEHFEVAQDKIWIVRENVIELIPNPLKIRRRTWAFGAGKNISVYFKYLQNIMSMKTVPQKHKFDNILLLPYKFNALHFYAYFNHMSYSRLALERGVYFVESNQGFTPLDIAMIRRPQLVSDFIEYLTKLLKANKTISYFFIGRLSALNMLQSSSLADLYNSLFVNLRLDLADSCGPKIKLPILIYVDNPQNLQTSDFFTESLVKTNEKPVIFKQFLVEMNLKIGSDASINFLESLINSPNTNIFTTEFIQIILRSKWIKLRWIMAVQAIFYSVYLLALLLYIASELEPLLFVALHIINALLFAYEIVQMFAIRGKYFSDLLNIVDICRCIVFYIYTFMEIIIENEILHSTVLLFLVVLSFLRGINYFKVYSQTRYMVFLIAVVLQDMGSFMIVLMYSLLGFTVVFMTLNYENPDFLSNLEKSYLTSLGMVETSDYPFVERAFLDIAALINMIVMLNLLISILGDSFDKVNQGHLEADRRALAEMILEVESMLVWNRDNDDYSHIVVCMKDQINEKENTWEGKVNTIVKNIASVKASLAETQKKHEVKLKEICDKQDRLLSHFGLNN